MSEETLDPKETIDALIESNDILQEEVSRLRVSNKVVRTVNRALRDANKSLQRQVDLAQFNDETFKSFCNGEFDARFPITAEGGLPEAGKGVESLAIDSEEASASSTSS
jgi:hypothetical protein